MANGPPPAADASGRAIDAGAGAGAGQHFATKTVYGFLDFTTTVGETVMVFKPSKAPGI